MYFLLPDSPDYQSEGLRWFDLVIRGVFVNILGILGLVLNTLIIVVVRKPELKRASINLVLLCKYPLVSVFN